MKIHLKCSAIACMVSSLGLAGCEMGKGNMTPDAELARQILAQSCVIGLWHSGGGRYGSNIEYVRHGKINKRSDALNFHSTIPIRAERVYVHSLKTLDGDWLEADASYEGNRENLYFNKNSGAFTCSTDEWRAVHAVPQSRSFEVSPLIVSTKPKTTAD